MWNRFNIVKFWNEYNGPFAGDVSAPEIVRLSRKYIGKRVLDIGAGSGALIDLIPNAIGLDLAPKHPKILNGSVSDIPFNNESFDTIFATEVLEHLDNKALDKGLDEIYRVLQRKGYFIITVPYKENLRENMVLCPRCGARFHPFGHFQSFDKAALRSVLENKGFKIIALKALPLYSMAKHAFLKYFQRLFNKLNLGFKPDKLFAIARKENGREN